MKYLRIFLALPAGAKTALQDYDAKRKAAREYLEQRGITEVRGVYAPDPTPRPEPVCDLNESQVLALIDRRQA